MKINKILSIAICLSAACALAGCASSNNNSSSPEQTGETSVSGQFESVNDSDAGTDSETVDDSVLAERKESTEGNNNVSETTDSKIESSDDKNDQSDTESASENSSESASETDNAGSAAGVYQFSTYQVTISENWTVESSTDVGINLNAPSGGLMEIGTLNTSRSAEGWAEFVAEYTGTADAVISSVTVGNYEYYTFSTGEDAYYFTEKESDELKTVLQIHTNGINSDNAASQIGMIEIY